MFGSGKKNCSVFGLLSIFIFLQSIFLSHLKPSHVRLQNGYVDVVVSFPADSTEGRRTFMIQSVQDLFKYSSRVLYVVTKRRANFRKIILLIPRSWGAPESWLPREESNITVFESNGGFPSTFDGDIVLIQNLTERKNPYVLQDEECGKTGVRINVPVDFLIPNQDLQNKSIGFVHYWSQYRYGIFPEGGFQNDLRYPQYYSVPGTTDIRVTSCSNIPLSYDFIGVSDGAPCEPRTDNQTGMPVFEECMQIPVIDKLMTSSIMYQQALPHNFHFCEADQSLDRKHNPNAPSKHNVLCSQEGTWHVVLKSPDFAFGKNPATRFKPENVSFQFMQESNIRIVIAVDVSSSMTKNGRYDLIKNALTKFVLLDLPLGTDLGLVFFSEGINSVQGFVSLATEDAKRNFFESVPFYEDEDVDSISSCTTCAIEKSLQLLTTTSNGVQNGVVILFSSNESLSEQYRLKENMKTNNIRLYTLLFLKDSISFIEGRFVCDDCELLENLVSESRGRLLKLPEGQKVKTLSHMYLFLHEILSEMASFTNEDHILFIKEISADETSTVLDFYVDESTAGDLKVLITGPDFQITRPILDVLHTGLMTPSGELTMVHKESLIPAWLYRIHSAEVGNYTFRSRRKDGAFRNYFIIVSGKPTADMAASITLKAWTSSPSSLVSGPLKLFAEIKYGNHPIINSVVSAIIRDSMGTALNEFLLLSDNGLGDPDITRNDGIYSKYCDISKIGNSGYYTITVHAFGKESEILYISNDDCCGSFVPSLKTKSTGPFTRMTGPLTYRLLVDKSSKYSSPPSRVLDLRIHKLHQEQRQIVLRWTSSGTHFDNGAAPLYRLKLFGDRINARRRFEETGLVLEYNRDIIQFTSPKHYGHLQEYVIQWPETLSSGFYFFALVAVCEFSGLHSDVSNVVEGFLENVPYNDSIYCDVPTEPGIANHFHATYFLISLNFISILIFNYLFNA